MNAAGANPPVEASAICPHCRRAIDTDAAQAEETAMAKLSAVAEPKPRGVSSGPTWRGGLLRLTAILLAAGLVVVGISWFTDPTRFAFTTPNAAAKPPRVAPPAPQPKASKAPTEEPKKLAQALRRAIVQIEADRPGDRGALGSGFLLEGGQIATCWHVISSATRARVRFHDGSVMRVAGYVAAAPAWDLAILQLETSPAMSYGLPLAVGPPPDQLDQVIAGGYPQGEKFSLGDGVVGKKIRTSQLSQRSQKFLARNFSFAPQIAAATPEAEDLMWLEHTAPISEGYSGGPLVNAQGEVVGVNTWLDQQTRLGYAQHVGWLRRLLQQHRLPKVEPLKNYARQNPRAEEWVRRLSASFVRHRFEEAQGIKWRPATQADYRILQELAWSITWASLPQALDGALRRGGLEEEAYEKLIAEADRVTAELSREKFNGPAQLTLVNELAVEQIDRPDAGLFFFAQVEKVVQGPDGSRAAVFLLSGMERRMLTPLDGLLIRLEPGAFYLVLGVNYEGRTIRYGENPLDPVIAPVVVSRTILPLM